VGVPGEDLGPVADAGAVTVLSAGTSTGKLWHQALPQVQDDAAAFEEFGAALAAGDFNGDMRADLAVGVPGEDFDGGINVLYAGASGLTDAGNQYWDQDSPGVEDDSDSFDDFGAALAAGDFDGTGFADLAVGVPDENLGSALANAGAVNVLYASASGLTEAGDDFWYQDDFRTQDGAEANDRFGFALAP
jgi:hypothetical protein